MSRYVRPSGDGPEYTDVLKAQVERLTAELAERKADAERYRWLRDKTTKEWLRNELVNSYNWDTDVSAAMEAKTGLAPKGNEE